MKQKTLFGLPIVEVDGMPEPVIVLSDWEQWAAHRIIDGSGAVIARGCLTTNRNLTKEEIERVQELWNRRYKGFGDAYTTSR